MLFKLTLSCHHYYILETTNTFIGVWLPVSQLTCNLFNCYKVQYFGRNTSQSITLFGHSSRASSGITPLNVGELSVSKALWPSFLAYCKQIDDGNTTLENEGRSAFETSGQFTHVRRRYPRRRPGIIRPFPENIRRHFDSYSVWVLTL